MSEARTFPAKSDDNRSPRRAAAGAWRHRLAIAARLALLALLVAASMPSSHGEGITVDRVNPRPRFFFAPGEFERFSSELSGPRQEAFNRLIQEIARLGTDSWSERDLQVESQALVARVLLDRGDPQGQRILDYARASVRRFLDSHTFERFSDSHGIITEGFQWLEAVALAHDWLYPRWTPRERSEMARWLKIEVDDWVDHNRLRRASPSPFRNDAARGVQGLLFAGLTLFDEPGYRGTAEKAIRHALPYYDTILEAHAYAGLGGGMAEGSFYGNFTAWSQTVIAELLYTAAGQTTAYTRSPFYKARLQYGIHASWPGYLTNKAGQKVEQLAPVFGDARRGPTGSALYHRAMLLLLGKRFAGSPAAAEAYGVITRQDVNRTYTAGWGLYDLLLWSPQVEPAVPTALSYREPTLGQVFARSDWSDSATWLSFNAGPHLDTHQHYDAGNLTLFRHVDLAVDSGALDGFGSSHWYNYYVRTIAHNTITITDPAERWDNIWSGVPADETANDGGQRTQAPLTPTPTLDEYLANRAAYDHGSIEGYSEGSWGVYIRSNLTNAYQNPAFQSARPDGSLNRIKATHVGREVLYLRSGGGRRDAIVVFDRVVSADPSFRKAVLWHSREPFETRLRSRRVGEGEQVFEGQQQFPFTATVGFDERSRKSTGRLYLTALAIDPVRVREIGQRPSTGSTPDHITFGEPHFHRHVKDYFVNDPSVVNPKGNTGAKGRPEWPPFNPPEEQWLFTDDLVGGWGQTRLEIEPAQPRPADRFMTVLVPTEAADAVQPRVDALRSRDDRLVGLLRREGRTADVAIFSGDQKGARLTTATVDVPVKEAALYLLDLTPEATYAVTSKSISGGRRISIAQSPSGLRADTAGMIVTRLGARRSSASALASLAGAPAGQSASPAQASVPFNSEGAVAIAPRGEADVRDWDGQIDRMIHSSELRLRDAEQDTMLPGRLLERFSQYHRGIRVFGGSVTRQTERGATTSLFGTVFPSIPDIGRPELSTDQAADVLQRLTGVELVRERAPELVIVPVRRDAFTLMYVARVATKDDVAQWFIDAATGHPAGRVREMRAGVESGGASEPRLSVSWTARRMPASCRELRAARVGSLTALKVWAAPLSNSRGQSVGGVVSSRSAGARPAATYDLGGNVERVLDVLNGREALDPSHDVSATGTADIAGRLVTDFGVRTLDYLRRRFGRRGLDGRGRGVLGIIHPGRVEAGALDGDERALHVLLDTFYAGRGLIVYADPIGEASGPTTRAFPAHDLATVAHEIGHGVIEYSSRLIYRDESGALDEAFAAILSAGVACEAGEPEPSGMPVCGAAQAPRASAARGHAVSGRQLERTPDHYSSRVTDEADNGGVHANATIVTQAFALAVEGGTNRTSTQIVQGVGQGRRDRIERIFYRALVLLLPSYPTFSMARAATLQAADDLYGRDSRERASVTAAWNAVGVY